MKSFNNLFFGIFLIFFLSCQKAPINGDLDGQWEVVEVIPEPENIVIDERLFYNFSLHVCMLSYYGGTLGYSNLEYNGENISLNFVEETPDGDFNALPQYGILSNPVTFSVKFENSHNLILTSNESKVILVKH